VQEAHSAEEERRQASNNLTGRRMSIVVFVVSMTHCRSKIAAYHAIRTHQLQEQQGSGDAWAMNQLQDEFDFVSISLLHVFASAVQYMYK